MIKSDVTHDKVDAAYYDPLVQLRRLRAMTREIKRIMAIKTATKADFGRVSKRIAYHSKRLDASNARLRRSLEQLEAGRQGFPFV